MAGENGPSRSLWLNDVPEWFLAVAAFVYATGFLVVFTYFESFGIREVGGDFFRVKYVQVGIFCILFQTFMAIALYVGAIVAFRKHPRPSTAEPNQTPFVRITDPPGHLSSVALIVNMLASFYVFAMFAPSGYLQERSHLIPLILLVPLVILAVISLVGELTMRFTVGSARREVSMSINAHTVARILRLTLCILFVVIGDWYCFRDLSGELKEMFFGPPGKATGGYVVFLFVSTIVFVTWRTSYRLKTVDDKKMRLAFWSLSGCLILATYYLAVLAFAFRVYPYIPADKGGGGFVGVAAVTLHFKADSGSGAIPADIFDCGSTKCQWSKPMVIVEETASAFFLADPNDSGGPIAWRQGTNAENIERKPRAGYWPIIQGQPLRDIWYRAVC